MGQSDPDVSSSDNPFSGFNVWEMVGYYMGNGK